MPMTESTAVTAARTTSSAGRKAIINQDRFLHAVEHISSHYFSKPYSITPMVDRWLNQLAMVHLANGKLIHLSGKEALQHVDIKVDGEVIPKADIELVLKFYSRKSEYEKEKANLLEEIRVLSESLPTEEAQEDESEEIKLIRTQLEALKTKLLGFETDQLKAKELYEKIVERGESTINKESIEGAYGSPIVNIVYRPNHGLMHSVRAAYSITSIYTLLEKHGQATGLNLNEKELEKVQFMMLLSVVGRRDETGFNDGSIGHETYESFRTSSGRAYVDYCQTHLKDFYENSMIDIYRDAVIVELMGYSSIDDAISRGKIPEVLIDYFIEEEKAAGRTVSRSQVKSDIEFGRKGLHRLFPTSEIVNKANAKLFMMNDAHALDLTRCYSLFGEQKASAKGVKVLSYVLSETGFTAFKDTPDPEKLSSFFNLVRYSFDTMELTGQNTMFGMLSAEEFAAKKDDLLKKIKEISDDCRTSDPTRRAALIKEARAAHADEKSFFQCASTSDDKLLAEYRTYLIERYLAEELSKGKKLNPDVRMFNFNHVKRDDAFSADHHKNALSIVRALQTVTPYPGVAANVLPLIDSVKHQRRENQVELTFADRTQVERFTDTYSLAFDSKPPAATESEGKFHVVIDRKLYQELVGNQLIEFKTVTIPAEVAREDSLIDDDGFVGALNLIQHSRALVRLTSTASLDGKDFPDYDYFLRALEDPVHERFVPEFRDTHWRVDRSVYQDPRSGITYSRHVVDTPVPDIRFQEPQTGPRSFSDKVADGWRVHQRRTAAKNTIFTKKLAHSLLPPHGKVIPFTGYGSAAPNYFPIGVLSDISQVDLKDERYVFARNADSVTKFWIRDNSAYNVNLFAIFNAKLDNDQKVERYASGVAKIDKTQVPHFDSPKALVEFVERKTEKFSGFINNKFYRPSDDVIKDLMKLAKQQKSEFLAQLPLDDKVNRQRIHQAYAGMQKQLEMELARTSSKYAVSLRELIEQQRETTEAGEHNEILAGNTKGAIQALYASKDELFDRLNLAFHAMKIKEKYHYDIPLLVISRDKPPYHYTADMIKKDMLTAYKLLREGTFPYDRSLHPLLARDMTGRAIRRSDGSHMAQQTSDGRDIMVPKNLPYQRQLLVDLFKLGMPELTSITQLTKGKVGRKPIDEARLETAVAAAVSKMGVIGSLERETQLMEKVFSDDNEAKKNDFFLRAAALGHQSLIEKMLADEDFEITEKILEKAILYAHNNNHSALEHMLSQKNVAIQEKKSALEGLLSRVEDLTIPTSERLTVLADVAKRYESLSEEISVPDLYHRYQQTARALLLNEASQVPSNKVSFSTFCNMLLNNPPYFDKYIALIDSKKSVNLNLLLAFNKRYGVEITANFMQLSAIHDEQIAEHYRLLSARHEEKMAAKFLELAIAHPNDSVTTWKEYAHFLVGNIDRLSNDLQDGEPRKQNKARAEQIESLTDVSSLVDLITELEKTQQGLETTATNIEKQKEEIELCFEALDELPSQEVHAIHTHRIETILELHKRFAKLNAIVKLPEFETRVYEKTMAILCSPLMATPENRRQLSAFVKLLSTEGHDDYIEKYADILLSGNDVKFSDLIEAHGKFDKSTVVNAMSLVASANWDTAQEYLLLKERHEDETAQRYLDDPASRNKETIRSECLSCIRAIELAAMGDSSVDPKTHHFCQEMREKVSSCTKFADLYRHMRELQRIQEAVTSPEMEAIRQEIGEIRRKANSRLSMGYNRKADQIIGAVSGVELIDRLHVFSAEENPACNQVRISLASYRKNPFRAPVAEGHVDPEKASRAFTNVGTAIAQFKAAKETIKGIKDGDESASTPTPTAPPRG